MRRTGEAGVTLVELAVVLAVISVMLLVTLPGMLDWSSDQRVKSAARSVADALMLGRAEAIRTGRNHLVVFQGALGAAAPIAVADDGAPGTGNCNVDAGEVRHSVPAEPDVVWGTTPSLAGTTPAPDDGGLATGEVETGSSFSDATLNPASGASWVLFAPDGLPRLFTPATCAIASPGQGGGAIYLSNTRRDYAVVLAALGTVRVHAWNGDAWRQ